MTTTQECIDNGIARKEIQPMIFEFYDTLKKIKDLSSVLSVFFTKDLEDIYVVLEKDNIDLSEHIMEKFSLWEASYKIFPELHIINQDEKFYIPNGSISF